MYRNMCVIDEVTSGAIKLTVSQHSVQGSKKLIMNRQKGTHTNSVLMLFCAILTGRWATGSIDGIPLVVGGRLCGSSEFLR